MKTGLTAYFGLSSSKILGLGKTYYCILFSHMLQVRNREKNFIGWLSLVLRIRNLP